MNNNNFGSARRRQKRDLSRKQHENKILEQIKNLIVKYVPVLEYTSIDEEVYLLQIQCLLDKIKQDYTDIDDYRIARNSLSREINEGNKRGQYYLPIPSFIIQTKRGSILRTQNWFKKSKEINKWMFHWHSALSDSISESTQPSAEYLLASSLISSAMYGGLSMPEAIVSLANQLTQLDKPLLKYGELTWFDLSFQSVSQDANFRLDDKGALTLRRWYPDPVSLAWINNFLQVKNDKPFLLEKVDQKKCWHLIQGHMKNIVALKAINSFKSFCIASIGVLENLKGVELPTTLLEYASGSLPSASLTPDYQQALLTSSSRVISTVNFNKFELLPSRVNRQTQKRQSISFKYEKTIELVREALQTKHSNGEKITPKTAIKSLNEIDLSRLPVSVAHLICWLIYLLEVRMVTVSTAKTYFSKIGALWLTYMAELDLCSLDECCFEDIYLLMMNSVHSEKSRRDKMSILNDLHDFGIRTLSLPVLTNKLLRPINGKQNFVRVGFISEVVFSDLCKALIGLIGLDNLANKGLVCLVILAYRLGLRRGELLKLQLRDIENSTEQWLYVRENQFDNNKTSSALRKIPISVLLTPTENSLFKSYLVERKRLVSDSPQSLVFSKSQTPTLPFESNSIGGVVSSILRELTGLPYTFHHLRHSALSRLHLIIERQDGVIREFTDYDNEQVKAIQKIILSGNANSTPRDNYWALAGIAGHSTPETTFSNYLHFVDRILFERLNNSEVNFSITEMRAISGISSNYLTRLCKKKKISSKNIPISTLYTKVIDDISPFCNEISIENKGHKLKFEDNVIFKRTIDVKDCLKVLEQVEKGATVSELVFEYQINEALIKKWINKAKELANIKTSKGNSVLFKVYEGSKTSAFRLSPQKPQSKAELDDAENAINEIRNKYKSNKDLNGNFRDNKSFISWCIDYFIRNTSRSSTAILFKEKEFFETFIGFMIEIFPRNRWSLYLEVVNHEEYTIKKQIEDWRNKSQGIHIVVKEKTLKNSSFFPEGRMSLYLAHPDEKEVLARIKYKNKIAKKYSTATLRYVFHTLAIML